MLILDTNLDQLIELDEDEPIQCESYYEREQKKLPPHIAHWYATSRCGAPVIAVCEQRRLLCYVSDGWKCYPIGCGEWHAYNEMGWTQIQHK